MATFITRLDHASNRTRLAVKDLIDIAGVPTTAGSRAVADTAAPAATDAPCLAGARSAGVSIVGKVNLHELAYGASGVNHHFGTPVNPLAPDRVPGGSSSGSAVAIANDEADIAYGSDTGGSIRIPSAFCGITGLKTTHGRVSLNGVWPLAPSLDTVGPMALDVAGVAAGMTLLEPGFTVDARPAGRVGRIRPAGVDIDPDIDAAIDLALARSGLEVVEADLAGWQEARDAVGLILDAEAADSNRILLDDPARNAMLGADVRARLGQGAAITAAQLARARAFQPSWRIAMTTALQFVDVLALPTVMFYPPLLGEAFGRPYTALTNPVNLSGFPALALPVPSAQRLPASLQLIGLPNSEALLLSTGAIVEAAAGCRRGRQA
ncbi:MAG TPA: amidase [Streptosporangiaceae bacterium]|nr:amidase [Streptosporangiaceae bacterium]